MTEYKYSDAGLVASVVRKDGAETITSVSVAYDKNRHTNTYTWDGLALIQRGDEQFINEPHVGNAPKKLCFEGKPRAQRSARRSRKGPRGNPVVSSKGTNFFNDMLGTTVGAEKGSKYSAAALSAFGEDLNLHCPPPPTFSTSTSFFTGKPAVAGLGHAFLMRNYRAGLGKWQTADPLGYPDGWNALAYCNNGVTRAVDLWGCKIEYVAWNGDAQEGVCHYQDLIDAGMEWELHKDLFGFDIIAVITPRKFVSRVNKDGHVYDVYRYNVNTVQYTTYYNWAEMDKTSLTQYLLAVGGAVATVVGGVLVIVAPQGGMLFSTGISVSEIGAATSVSGLLMWYLEKLSSSDIIHVAIGYTSDVSVLRSVPKYERVLVE